jgi:quercetin dioxygenase-like cupin family protein
MSATENHGRSTTMSDTGTKLLRWNDLPKEQLGEGMARRFIWGERLMMSQIESKAGNMVPKHHHDNEQLSNVISGRMEFRLGDDGADVRIVGPGEALIIPANVPHQVITLEDTVLIELFSPPRQDWIDGTDDYLRPGEAS